VESKVRDACKLDGVVAVGWPKTDSGFGGVEVFIEGQETTPETLRATLAKDLPEYMVPRRFHFMERLPRNANNKYDRNAMRKLLEEGL
jgi:acyl-coenzyme A synthetase/AMP-(fatty) acid ligase